MPLALAPEKATLKITKILVDEKTKKHLSNLGLIPGAEITVFSSSKGNVIILFKESRLAIDHSVAMKILVA